jgi:hypothetical protein
VKAERKARIGRNPQTGAAIKIKAKTVVKFRVAKAAKDVIAPPRSSRFRTADTGEKPSASPLQLPALTETYKHLHRTPELSRHEEQTSAFVAGELRKLGYTVTEHVGKYEDGAQAFGVVAVLENGPGPRLLIRTDMDALPVEEKTGLDYASTVKTTNAQGSRWA